MYFPAQNPHREPELEPSYHISAGTMTENTPDLVVGIDFGMTCTGE